MNFRPFLIGLLALVLLCAAGPAVQATVVSPIELGNPNSALSVVTGPYGSVAWDVTSSTTADVTLTAYDDFLFGGNGALGLNINSTGTITISNLVWTGGAGDTSFSQTSGNEDGFGTFNFVLDGFDGMTRAVTSLSFTVTDTSASWTDSTFLTANAGGNHAAGHVYVPDSVYSGGLTGYAGDGNVIPEPIGLVVWGIGSAGAALAVASRRRRQRWSPKARAAIYDVISGR